MNLIFQPSAVQHYLAQNIAKLRPSTTLIISSAPPSSTPTTSRTTSIKIDAPTKTDHPLQNFHSQISSHTQSIQFFTSMQHNLKTMQYGSTSFHSSYPTKSDVDQSLDIIRRTGVDHIIGVGNGAAIDLAKICHSYMTVEGKECDGVDDKNNHQQLILVPSTLGGVLASTSKHGLVLDVEEEALIVPQMNSAGTINSRNLNVLVDQKSISIPTWINQHNHLNRTSNRFNVPTITDAMLASLVIALDFQLALWSVDDLMIDEEEIILMQQHKKSLNQSLLLSISCLKHLLRDEGTNADDTILDKSNIVIDQKVKKDAIEALIHSGSLLSFGNLHSPMNLRRNISLALSSALLPKYFPHGNWMTFTASLLPGVIEGLADIDIDKYKTLRQDKESNFDLLSSSIEWMKEDMLIKNSGNIPSLSALVEGTPDVTELVQQVEHNGAFLDCEDCDSDLLELVLGFSLNR